jgi:hypothetical protein
MTQSKQPIKEPLGIYAETKNSTAGGSAGHPISALQMNISGRTSGFKNCIKFLLKGFIERSRPDVFPCPTFVALHDGSTDSDCKTIQKAFDVREGCVSGLEKFKSPSNDGVHLLYNSNTVECLTGTSEDILAQDDFFKNEIGNRSEQLFKRIVGGLFQHRVSTQYIVAISYHGIHASTTKLDKEKYLKGIQEFARVSHLFRTIFYVRM